MKTKNFLIEHCLQHLTTIDRKQNDYVNIRRRKMLFIEMNHPFKDHNCFSIYSQMILHYSFVMLILYAKLLKIYAEYLCLCTFSTDVSRIKTTLSLSAFFLIMR